VIKVIALGFGYAESARSSVLLMAHASGKQFDTPLAAATDLAQDLVRKFRIEREETYMPVCCRTQREGDKFCPTCGRPYQKSELDPEELESWLLDLSHSCCDTWGPSHWTYDELEWTTEHGLRAMIWATPDEVAVIGEYAERALASLMLGEPLDDMSSVELGTDWGESAW
jgi:hypothetical protein